MNKIDNYSHWKVFGSHSIYLLKNEVENEVEEIYQAQFRTYLEFRKLCDLRHCNFTVITKLFSFPEALSACVFCMYHHCPIKCIKF